MPTLDVYITTYNRSCLLKQQIESVLRQTYTDFQVYVLDNASTDDTTDVVSSFVDSRIHYIRHDHNIGAINNGRYPHEHCLSDFYVILADDDIIDNTFLETEINCLLDNNDITVVTCQCKYIDMSNGIINNTSNKTNGVEVLYKDNEYFISFIKKMNTITFPTAMYRNSFIKKHRLSVLNEVGPCTDVILISDICRFGGSILELPVSLYNYRISSLQDSSVNSLSMYYMLYDYISKNDYYKRLFNVYSNYHYKHYIYSLYRAMKLYSNKQIDINYVKEYKRDMRHFFCINTVLDFIINIVFEFVLLFPYLFSIINNLRRRG